MNILSWAALAVLVYYAFKGWRRGLIMTVFSMFATVIAIALAAQLSPQLSQNWQNTAYFDQFFAFYKQKKAFFIQPFF